MRGVDPAAPARPEVAAYVEQVMGMPVSVHIRGPRPRGADVRERVADVFAWLRRADALFSTYRPDSDVSRINAGTLALADADPLVREVRDLAALARLRTGGLFDVELPVPGGHTFDPSGLVKGWAAERAATSLAQITGHDYCLNAGGDVVVGCSADGALPWRVGVADPSAVHQVLGVIERRSGAVATSGTAARGRHLIDPRDGSAPTTLLSVTVVGPSLMWADVLATAAFIRGTDAAQWVSRNVGYSAVVVHADGQLTATPGLGLLTAAVGPASASVRPPTGAARS